MKKKTLMALALAATMVLSACGTSQSESASSAASEEPASSAAAEATPAPEESAEPTEAPAAGEEVDVGGPYPATTDWDEYVLVEYYFEETDETVPMLIETNADHTRFNTLFDFFGDKQEMTFSVNDEELTVDYDLSGFIGKDVEKFYTFIQENVTEWTPIA